jgi:predicted amidohydrolase YtcJ
MLIARAELLDGRVCDVRLRPDEIVEVGNGLQPQRDEDVIDARGCLLLPGLHDHHVHLRALAAARASIAAGPDRVGNADQLATAFARATTEQPGAWLRAIGYHESVAGDLDRAALDALSPRGVPVRVQHRSGMLWILNSAAVDATALESRHEPGIERDGTGRCTGRLWRRDDIVRTTTSPVTDFAWVGSRAARAGITGLTDATPHDDADGAAVLARDARGSGLRQRLYLMGPCRATTPTETRVALGPVKILLDDTDLPSIDDLAATVRAAHAEQRRVAFHCVTRVQLVVALAALDSGQALPGDRIEHGSLIPRALIDDLERLSVTVVTQPHFVAERGEQYLDDLDRDDIDDLYRCRSLLDASVRVAGGTDAPFGSPDPWASMAAAVERRTRAGQVIGAAERVPVDRALRMYLGHPADPARPRPLHPGARADVCLLTVPFRSLGDALHEEPVQLTVIGGEVAFSTS